MTVIPRRLRAAVLLLAAFVAAPALAGAKASSSPSPLLPGANSKEPISIEADKLNYYDKDQKAVYTGNVVAIQGDSRLTCTVMTIFLAKADAPTAGVSKPAAPAPAANAPQSAGGSQVKHMDAVGPVTVVSKTQVATGDKGAYDKEQNKIWLTGNVTLSDEGGNVTKGDKLTYDLTTGEAVVEGNVADGHTPPHRVTGVFIQGSGSAAADDGKPTDSKKVVIVNPKDKPKTATKQVPASVAGSKSSGT